MEIKWLKGYCTVFRRHLRKIFPIEVGTVTVGHPVFVQNLAILKPPSVRTSSMYGPLTFINTNHNSANIEMVLKGFKIFLYNLGPRQRCAYKPII